MAVSITYQPDSNSAAEWLARGKRLAIGTLTLSTYSSSGITCSINAFTNFEAVFIAPLDAGRYCQYDHSNSVLHVYGFPTTTAAGNFEAPTDTEAACFTAPMFLAIGRD